MVNYHRRIRSPLKFGDERLAVAEVPDIERCEMNSDGNSKDHNDCGEMGGNRSQEIYWLIHQRLTQWLRDNRSRW